jgi:hypothetical protein
MRERVTSNNMLKSQIGLQLSKAMVRWILTDLGELLGRISEFQPKIVYAIVN